MVLGLVLHRLLNFMSILEEPGYLSGNHMEYNAHLYVNHKSVQIPWGRRHDRADPVPCIWTLVHRVVRLEPGRC